MSFLAFFMAMIVQSVVAFDISGDNEAVGKVVAGQGIAMAAFGPLGGAFVDRWPKKMGSRNRRFSWRCKAGSSCLYQGRNIGGQGSCEVQGRSWRGVSEARTWQVSEI